MKEAYKKRREYVYTRLIKYGTRSSKARWSVLFLCQNPLNRYDPRLTFVLSLVKEEKVAVVPGSAFSSYGEGYFRLSFACSHGNIRRRIK